MRQNKLLTNPQDQNGYQGEMRSRSILSKRFHIYKGSADRQGIDLMVEIVPKSMHELEQSKKGVKIFGLVQAKYFKKGTSLRIDAEYIEDVEGVIPNFFVLIHTTDETDIDHHYFFTADEVKKKLSLKKDTKNNFYYSFSITKTKTFEQHRDLSHTTINDTITEQIEKTAEFRYQEILRKADEKWIKPGAGNKNTTRDFHESLKDLHPVEKIWRAARYYREFGHMLGWRIAEKLSFQDKINDQTSYNRFTLKSTNTSLNDFFDSISIDEQVKISKKKFFAKIDHPLAKAKEIIERLNNGNIQQFIGKDDVKMPIRIINHEECRCAMCLYESLNFKGSFESTKEKSDTTKHYEELRLAHISFLLGLYPDSQVRLQSVIDNTNQTRDFIPGYIAAYNLDIVERHGFYKNTKDLNYELLKLPVEGEKKQILKSISERSLLNDYRQIVDELYLTVKEYKERILNYSTGPTIDRLRTKIRECYFFYRGNSCFITQEFELLFEKYIECCCISYSLQKDHRSHLSAFDDFDIMLMLLYCTPDKLLRFIQRNSIQKLKCIPNGEEHFRESLLNFFHNDNLTFLHNQIKFTDHRTENPVLRRKAIAIFTSACYIYTYIDMPFNQDFIDMFFKFVSMMDFSPDETSAVAHIILDQYEHISQQSLLKLLQAVIQTKEPKSYLPANIMFALAKKGYVLQDLKSYDSIAFVCAKNPETNLLAALWGILDIELRNKFCILLREELILKFNSDLYCEAVRLEILAQPLEFSLAYSQQIKLVMSRPDHVFFDQSNPITGLPPYKHEQVENFSFTCQKLGAGNFDTEVVKDACNLHPYFNFFINLTDFKASDPFNIDWLTNDLHNQKLHLIKRNPEASKVLTAHIKTCNDKILLKKFVHHFI